MDEFTKLMYHKTGRWFLVSTGILSVTALSTGMWLFTFAAPYFYWFAAPTTFIMGYLFLSCELGEKARSRVCCRAFYATHRLGLGDTYACDSVKGVRAMRRCTERGYPGPSCPLGGGTFLVVVECLHLTYDAIVSRFCGWLAFLLLLIMPAAAMLNFGGFCVDLCVSVSCWCMR